MKHSPFDEDDSKGRFISQGQVGMIRAGLENILTNAETLQRKPGLTQEEKGKLEEIKKDAHGIARILKQARPERSDQ